MFGLKIPTVWLNSAFMLPVSQAEHLIKTHLGLNAKNQDGHIRTEGTSFSLCKGTLNLEWYHDFHTWGCTTFYTILDHHSYPWPSYPHPLACTHTQTYTHMVGCTVETKTLDILKKNTKVKVLILIISSTIIYWTSISTGHCHFDTLYFKLMIFFSSADGKKESTCRLASCDHQKLDCQDKISWGSDLCW